MRIQEIIRRPLITEKSTELRDERNIVAFQVDRRANKIEIRRAVEAQFGVKVAEVRTARVRGKLKRMGRFFGRRPEWQKAWVRLTPESGEIEFFEAT